MNTPRHCGEELHGTAPTQFADVLDIAPTTSKIPENDEGGV